MSEDLPALRAEVNFIFQRIMDRLDKLEGLRDSFESESSGSFAGSVSADSVKVTDSNDTTVHSLGSE